MTNRTGTLHLLGAALLIAAAIVVVLLPGVMLAQTGESSGTLYEKIRNATNLGDKQAQRYLQRIDDYLNSRRVPIPPSEQPIQILESINGAEIKGEGLAPYYIKVYNETDISSMDELNMYIATRTDVLLSLAQQDPSKLIEASISFQGYTNLARIWELKDAYDIDIDGTTLQIFLNGEYHSVMYVGDPIEEGDIAYINFETSLDGFIEQILQLMPAASFEEGGVAAGVSDPSQFEFKIT